MGRRYPDRPIVGVAGVVLAGERVLLVKRGAEPAKGLWSVPGGAVEVGETLTEACQREVFEETGVTVEVGELVEVVERLSRDSQARVEYHYILMDYLCSARHMEPIPGDDAADARWVELEALDTVGLTEDTARVIRKAAAMAGRKT